MPKAPDPVVAAEVRWVTLGPEPHFATCLRCGEHIEASTLPIPIKTFVAQINARVLMHRNCPPVNQSMIEESLHKAVGAFEILIARRPAPDQVAHIAALEEARAKVVEALDASIRVVKADMVERR